MWDCVWVGLWPLGRWRDFDGVGLWPLGRWQDFDGVGLWPLGRWQELFVLGRMFRLQNIRIPKYSAFALLQSDGAAVNSPSAKNCLRACAPCLCSRMLRDSNILSQSLPSQDEQFPPAVVWQAYNIPKPLSHGCLLFVLAFQKYLYIAVCPHHQKTLSHCGIFLFHPSGNTFTLCCTLPCHLKDVFALLHFFSFTLPEIPSHCCLLPCHQKTLLYCCIFSFSRTQSSALSPYASSPSPIAFSRKRSRRQPGECVCPVFL